MTGYQLSPRSMVGSAAFTLTQRLARPGTRQAAVYPMTGQLARQGMYHANQSRPVGSEALPQGIIAKASNLEMRPLWGPVAENNRRFYKLRGSGRCDDHNTAPPCIGWVEMLAPVFSRAAWRCAWYMIQNDLIHAWGLNVQLGYCAQVKRQSFIEMQIFNKRWNNAAEEDKRWADPYQ
ncbi:uncharacterized protein LOC130755393 [Actinidia eriantha]|uniref:uncharacterized protein LOC130755393 n=1 Tax=Actinidia eriantha TaxID=165200 RepID=UPI002590F7A2|nr:uncharacterized protein LOC130755393 [Actinidia eriantha]